MLELIQILNSHISGIFGQITELIGIALGLILIFWFRGFFKIILTFKSGKTTEGRSNLVDMMKGIAIHGVVIIHIDSYFRFFHQNDFPTFVTLLLSNLSRFAVPWFIITSGMFLHWKTASSYWSAKIKHLVIPYILVCIVAYPVKYHLDGNSVLDFFIKTIDGSVFTPYYFVPLLIEFYILYAVLLKNINRGKIGLYLVISFIINLLSNHYLEKVIGHAMSASSFTNYIFYFIFGMAIGRSFKNPEDLTAIITCFPGFKIILTIALLAYIAVISHGTWHFHFEASNHYLFYPVVLFILVYLLFGKKDISYLTYTGKNSLGIFLLHPFIIHMMHSFDPYTVGGPIVAFGLALVINISWSLLIWKIAEFLIGNLLPKEYARPASRSSRPKE